MDVECGIRKNLKKHSSSHTPRRMAGRVANTWLAVLVVLGLLPLWADAFGLGAPRIGLDRPSVRLGALSQPHKVRVVAEVREAMGVVSKGRHVIQLRIEKSAKCSKGCGGRLQLDCCRRSLSTAPSTPAAAVGGPE